MVSLEVQVQKLFVKACVRPVRVEELHCLLVTVEKPVETMLASPLL